MFPAETIGRRVMGDSFDTVPRALQDALNNARWNKRAIHQPKRAATEGVINLGPRFARIERAHRVMRVNAEQRRIESSCLAGSARVGKDAPIETVGPSMKRFGHLAPFGERESVHGNLQ